MKFSILIICFSLFQSLKAQTQFLHTDGIWVWDNGVHKVYYNKIPADFYAFMKTQSSDVPLPTKERVSKTGSAFLSCVPDSCAPTIGTSSYIHMICFQDKKGGLMESNVCRRKSEFDYTIDWFKSAGISEKYEQPKTSHKIEVTYFNPKTGGIRLKVGKAGSYLHETYAGKITGNKMVVYMERSILRFVPKSNDIFKLYNLYRTYTFYPFGTVPPGFDGKTTAVRVNEM